MKSDYPSKLFSQFAYKLHPKLGKFYDCHIQFFNDGFVELICLLIANGFIWSFSLQFTGFTLIVMLTLICTPVTFVTKYALHKFWVWKT